MVILAFGPYAVDCPDESNLMDASIDVPRESGLQVPKWIIGRGTSILDDGKRPISQLRMYDELDYENRMGPRE